MPKIFAERRDHRETTIFDSGAEHSEDKVSWVELRLDPELAESVLLGLKKALQDQLGSSGHPATQDTGDPLMSHKIAVMINGMEHPVAYRDWLDEQGKLYQSEKEELAQQTQPSL